VWFGKCEAFSLAFFAFLQWPDSKRDRAKCFGSQLVQRSAQKISGICLWLTLAAGLVLDLVCYRGIDTPPLLIQHSQFFAVSGAGIGAHLFSKKKAKLRRGFSVEVFGRECRMRSSERLLGSRCQNE
jgi:hypothetical protein